MSNNIAFARTTQNIGHPGFIVDPSQVVRDMGHQIDWDSLDNTYSENPHTVQLNGAVAIGATSITVDPLTVELEVGDVLEFGELAPVTVHVGASALANATSITVTALTGPIPDNTLLDFGTTKFARVNGDVAVGATTITVDAIPTALAGGENATFEGGSKALVLDAHADIGDTTITVEESPFALADNSQAVVPGPVSFEVSTGSFIKAGTVMCLLSSGMMVPRAVRPGSETAFALLASDAHEDNRTSAASGFGVIKSGAIFENLLPEADGNTPSVINSTFKTELLANGGFWMFEQYTDNTA